MKSPARLRLQLLHRIQRRYPTVTEVLRFGSVTLSFTRVADPNRVLDDIVAEETRREKQNDPPVGDPLHLPYWAELWDSAGGVAMALASAIRPDSLPSASVLDLGCGMGLAGAVAAALEARVLFADVETPSLLFARLNSLTFADRCRTRQLNWRTHRLDERFSLVLGGDILYERQQWEFLDEFWKSHLSPGGEILLGEPGRESGELFVPWITRRGWKLQQLLQPIPSRPQPIKIFRLHRL